MKLWLPYALHAFSTPQPPPTITITPPYHTKRLGKLKMALAAEYGFYYRMPDEPEVCRLRVINACVILLLDFFFEGFVCINACGR